MKIELIKQTTEISGTVYYYVRANGSLQPDTWTKDEAEAKQHLGRITELARKYPETVCETLETVNI